MGPAQRVFDWFSPLTAKHNYDGETVIFLKKTAHFQDMTIIPSQSSTVIKTHRARPKTMRGVILHFDQLSFLLNSELNFQQGQVQASGGVRLHLDQLSFLRNFEQDQQASGGLAAICSIPGPKIFSNCQLVHTGTLNCNKRTELKKKQKRCRNLISQACCLLTPRTATNISSMVRKRIDAQAFSLIKVPLVLISRKNCAACLHMRGGIFVLATLQSLRVVLLTVGAFHKNRQAALLTRGLLG